MVLALLFGMNIIPIVYPVGNFIIKQGSNSLGVHILLNQPKNVRIRSWMGLLQCNLFYINVTRMQLNSG